MTLHQQLKKEQAKKEMIKTLCRVSQKLFEQQGNFMPERDIKPMFDKLNNGQLRKEIAKSKRLNKITKNKEVLSLF